MSMVRTVAPLHAGRKVGTTQSAMLPNRKEQDDESYLLQRVPQKITILPPGGNG
jgi:hypothetical protein